jgi:hypothetical protein
VRYLSMELKESLVRTIGEVGKDGGVCLEYCCEVFKLDLRRYGR